MRVYDHGQLQIELRVTCENPKCRCSFIYKPRNLKNFITYSFETKSGTAYRYVPCPECGAHYIHTDPSSQRYFNDALSGVNIDKSHKNDLIYDGGDEDSPTSSEEQTSENTIVYNGGDEDS